MIVDPTKMTHSYIHDEHIVRPETTLTNAGDRQYEKLTHSNYRKKR